MGLHMKIILHKTKGETLTKSWFYRLPVSIWRKKTEYLYFYSLLYYMPYGSVSNINSNSLAASVFLSQN